MNTSPIDVHQSPDSNESEVINSEKEEISASLQKTRDRVFLLNAEEVEQYLTEADLRKCEITAHTTKNESNVNGWWLRSINSENNEMIQIVSNKTNMIEEDLYQKNNIVRPAIWIKTY